MTYQRKTTFAFLRYVDIGRGHISRPDISFDIVEKIPKRPIVRRESGRPTARWHVPTPRFVKESSPTEESPKRLPPGIDMYVVILDR